MTGTCLLPSGLRATKLLGGAGRLTPAGGPARSWSVEGFELPALGPCHHQPVLLILLFDNSPSVTAGNDAIGQRFGEAACALDQYRQRCDCGRELVAVRSFDRRTTSDVGPVHLDDDGWHGVTAALHPPTGIDRGLSRLRPALRGAEWLAHRYPHHRPALVVFSDFMLFDWFPSLVLDRLCDFPGQVHAVVLAAEPPARLLASPVTVSRITADSPPGDVARAIVAALADVPTGSGVR